MAYAEIETGEQLGTMKEWGGFAFLTAEEMAEADRRAIKEYGIDAQVLMENAGIATAWVARHVLKGARGKKVVCLVGKGNTGGDALVAARHLFNWGADVEVVLGSNRKEIRDLPSRQLAIVEKLGVKAEVDTVELRTKNLLVDGILGYGARGDPRGDVGRLVQAAVDSGVPVLAVDIPSGLDATTGERYHPCIRARWTVTLGYPKTGFLGAGAREFVGDLYLAYISLPAPQKTSGCFDKESVVKVW